MQNAINCVRNNCHLGFCFVFNIFLLIKTERLIFFPNAAMKMQHSCVVVWPFSCCFHFLFSKLI